jgi:hypothetical protein
VSLAAKVSLSRLLSSPALPSVCHCHCHCHGSWTGTRRCTDRTPWRRQSHPTPVAIRRCTSVRAPCAGGGSHRPVIDPPHTPAQARALTAARAPRPEPAPSGPWDGIPRKFEGVRPGRGGASSKFSNPGHPGRPVAQGCCEDPVHRGRQTCAGGRGPTRLPCPRCGPCGGARGLRVNHELIDRSFFY